MNCEHVENSLLERRAGDRSELSDHLDHCAACGALADAITAEEAAMYERFNAYLDPSDFDARWLQVETTPSSVWRASRWLQAAAVVLATVGALTLAAQSGKVDDGVSSGAAVPQEDPGAALPQEEVADDAAVEIQVGRSAMVRVEGEISAVSASDPEVIRAMQISPRSVQVQGTSVGEAVLRVEMRPGSADDEEYRFSVIATDQTPRPPSNPSIQTEPDEVISLQVGESQVVDFHGRVPSAVVMTAPEVCNPTVMAQPSQLKLSGIGIGITDLNVFFGVDQPGRYFHIEVE